MLIKLQYISQGKTREEQLDNISLVLSAGCKWVQLRFKNAPEKEFMELAGKVYNLCRTHSAIFIINDHVKIAKEVNADGVHLGLDDMPVAEARAILGNEKIIGGTANTLEDVLKRAEEKCDYAGLGPFTFTSTKEKLSPVLGVEGYRKIITELRKKKISLPVYAIGGISDKDVDAIMETGTYGIAVSGMLTRESHKKELVEQLNHKLHEGVQNR